MISFLNIKDLKKDHERKRLALQDSIDQLTKSIKEEGAPRNLLKNHPQVLIAATVLLASAAKIGKDVLFSSKARGTIGKLLTFAAGTGFRFITPMVKTVVKKLIQKKG